MHLSIITPENTLFSGKADMVTAPGALGDFGVLPGHMPFVSSLRPGAITVVEGGLQVAHFAVTEGIAEITPDHCTILTQAARSLENLSVADAQAELRAADEALTAAITTEDTNAAERRKKMAETALALLYHHP